MPHTSTNLVNLDLLSNQKSTNTPVDAVTSYPWIDVRLSFNDAITGQPWEPDLGLLKAWMTVDSAGPTLGVHWGGLDLLFNRLPNRQFDVSLAEQPGIPEQLILAKQHPTSFIVSLGHFLHGMEVERARRLNQPTTQPSVQPPDEPVVTPKIAELVRSNKPTNTAKPTTVPYIPALRSQQILDALAEKQLTSKEICATVFGKVGASQISYIRLLLRQLKERGLVRFIKPETGAMNQEYRFQLTNPPIPPSAVQQADDYLITVNEMTDLRDASRAAERAPAPIHLLEDYKSRKLPNRRPIIQPHQVDLVVAMVIIGLARGLDPEAIAQKEGLPLTRVKAIANSVDPYVEELKPLSEEYWVPRLLTMFPQVRGQIPSQLP